MLMVVLGAGASHDSVHPNDYGPGSDENFKPPLARELFEPKISFASAIDYYPACRPLISPLREGVRAGNDIEILLERLVERSGEEAQLPRQIMAVRFYLREVIDRCGRQWFDGAVGVTNHQRLLNTIETWRSKSDERVAYVTFNYDRMLEDAFRDTLNIPFNGVTDYIARHEHMIFKPHGSVHWGRVIGTTDQFPRAVPDVIDGAADLAESDTFVVADGNMRAGNEQAVPAIAVPTRTKGGFQCPNEHLNALREALKEVDWVLIIGWRGQEQHFLDMCRGLLPGTRMLVVDANQESAEGIAAHLREVLPQTKVASGAASGAFQGFSHLVREESFLDFLTQGKPGEQVPEFLSAADIGMPPPA